MDSPGNDVASISPSWRQPPRSHRPTIAAESLAEQHLSTHSTSAGRGAEHSTCAGFLHPADDRTRTHEVFAGQAGCIAAPANQILASDRLQELIAEVSAPAHGLNCRRREAGDGQIDGVRIDAIEEKSRQHAGDNFEWCVPTEFTLKFQCVKPIRGDKRHPYDRRGITDEVDRRFDPDSLLAGRGFEPYPVDDDRQVDRHTLHFPPVTGSRGLGDSRRDARSSWQCAHDFSSCLPFVQNLPFSRCFTFHLSGRPLSLDPGCAGLRTTAYE